MFFSEEDAAGSGKPVALAVGHSLDVVHLLDGLVGISLRGVADETESTAAAGIAVLNHDLASVRTRFGN